MQNNSLFPFLVSNAILHAGCHQSVAEKVRMALEELPPDAAVVLWMRLRGRSYRDIEDVTDITRTRAWRIIHGQVKDSVYSIIEHSTLIPATAMVS